MGGCPGRAGFGGSAQVPVLVDGVHTKQGATGATEAVAGRASGQPCRCRRKTLEFDVTFLD